MKKQLIWVFESRKSVHYWWSYIPFTPECKELTCLLDPLLYRWTSHLVLSGECTGGGGGGGGGWLDPGRDLTAVSYNSWLA